MKKFIKNIVTWLLILTLSLSLISCGKSTNNSELQSQSATDISLEYSETDLADFSTFTKNLFAEIIQQDTLTMHAFIQNPENFGINDYEVTLGAYDLENLDSTSDYVECLNQLKAFDRRKLSQKQQLTFDQLKMYLENELEYSDLYMYSSQLTPASGIQVFLPTILSEYSFDRQSDIDDYIKLLNQVDVFFESLIAYETKRSELGFFMEDTLADKVLAECQSFINNIDNNCLILTFNERIEAFSGLSETDITNYKNANLTAFNEHVIPGYNILIDGITKLKGTNKYPGGICHKPNGKKYYEYLMKSSLGWSKSIDELNSMLDASLNQCLSDMGTILSKDSSIIENLNTFSFKLTNPADILADLKIRIKEDFPDAPEVSYDIKYIDPSLEKYTNPAMYFLPQIDNIFDNAIYINNSSVDPATLYATLAHEGYPGHLYQSTYFASLNPDSIRCILRPDGYVEGWASYCELYSYSLAQTDNANLNEVMKCNSQAILDLYAKVDLGVNYYGWTLDETAKFLSDYGFSDSALANEMYYAMVQDPCIYPKYTIGCIAFQQLRQTAENSLQDKFIAKDFHRFLMELGPVQFDIAAARLDIWINENK